MKVGVIGATGHVGTYLVPMLDEAGHQVAAVSRGNREPYRPHPAFERAERVVAQRSSDPAAFAALIADIKADVVIDMICFKYEDAFALAEALRGSISHLLVCGTISIHGPSVSVPTTEEENRRPIGSYGERKLVITEYLERESRAGRLPATVIHPGHITGPGWLPINPEGHLNGEVFRRIVEGRPIQLTGFGMETLHHVHAEDVAALILSAMENWNSSVGQSFHAVSPAALTMRGFAQAMYRWAGHEPAIEYLPWSEWADGRNEQEVNLTKMLASHGFNCSIEKARRLLGFVPRYSALGAVQESVEWLKDHNYEAEA